MHPVCFGYWVKVYQLDSCMYMIKFRYRAIHFDTFHGLYIVI